MKWIIRVVGYICLASPSVANEAMQQELPPPPDLPSVTYSGAFHVLSLEGPTVTSSAVLFESNEGTVVAIPEEIEAPAALSTTATSLDITDGPYRYWYIHGWSLEVAINRLHQE